MDDTKKCTVCGKNAVFYSNYLRHNLCKKHFERMLIKRVRGNMVSNGLRGRAFHIKDENPCGYLFLKFLFEEVEKSEKVDIKSGTLEDFSIAVMKFFLFHDETHLRIKEKGSFSPLFNVSEREIESFFQFKNRKVNFITRTGKEKSTLDIISRIEQRRPGAMISLVKAGIELNII